MQVKGLSLLLVRQKLMIKSRLTEQLTYLLLRHEYVVIPQLGGFLREVLPAGYDPQHRVAFPPRAELHFSGEMLHSDGLLEERYALLLGTSLRRARLVLEEDVRQLRQTLVQQRSYQLAGIGRLLLSDEGRLSFEPQEGAPATRAVGYGYAPISFPLLPATSSAALPPREELASDGRYLSLRIPKRALAYAATVVVFLLALLPWGNKVTQEASYQAGFAPTIEAAKQLFGTTEEITSPATEQPAPQATAPTGLTWQDSADGRYHIILATERTEAQITTNYEHLREELPEATFVALRTRAGRMIRLSVGAYATSAEAYTQLNALVKAHPACRAAWVYASK